RIDNETIKKSGPGLRHGHTVSLHSVDVKKNAFSNAIPEIEILKRRKKEEIEKQQVLEIQKLEKCLSEMNEEVLLILHAQARQLQEVIKFKLGISNTV
ncbi:hypothetical protein BDDG_13904, partial [Blastomyces dermatitidis ATCC 18188]